MGLLEYIEKVREKPASVRRRFALTLTVLIMIIIVALWLSFAFVSRTEIEESAGQSPFSVVKDIFSL